MGRNSTFILHNRSAIRPPPSLHEVRPDQAEDGQIGPTVRPAKSSAPAFTSERLLRLYKWVTKGQRESSVLLRAGRDRLTLQIFEASLQSFCRFGRIAPLNKAPVGQSWPGLPGFKKFAGKRLPFLLSGRTPLPATFAYGGEIVQAAAKMRGD